MAEKCAHLSSTFVKKPSIFELIAQDSLANTFYPTLRHVANYFFSRDPVKYAFLQEWFEEVYLGFQLLFQTHYLKNYDATFSERFYSLKRIQIESNPKSLTAGLPNRQKILSLLFSVILPYFRNKFRVMSENIENNEEYKNKHRIPKQYHASFVKLFKTCHFVIEALSVFFYIQYMIGLKDAHSLFLQLAGVTLVYCHDEPQNIIHWKTMLKEVFSGNWRSTIDLFRVLKGFFGHSLELFAFFIQFLNWWHSEQLHAKFFAYPIPPAPHVELEAKDVPLKDVCPLCKKPFQIPTALPISGYVYCFVCIRKYVAQNRKCPVTSLPALEEDLVRIYANASDIQ